MKRPLFWIGLIFLSSTAVFLRFSPVIAIVAAILLSVSAAFLAAPKFSFKRMAVMLAFSLAAGGWVYLHQFSQHHYLSAVTDTSEEYAVIYATVTDCRPEQGYQTLSAHADITVGTETRSTGIRLSGYYPSAPQRGDVICCHASYRDGRYRVEGFIDSTEKEIRPLLSLRFDIQHAIGGRLKELFDDDSAAILSALITGDDSNLDRDTVYAFRKSSLSHLLVVSGMHLLIISHTVSILLGRFLPERISSLLTLLFCWTFAALSGFGVSIVRAAIMLTVMNTGELIGRKSDTLTSMMTAAIIILLPSPEAVVSASFLLSFSAVSGLALLQKPIASLFCGSDSHPVIRSLAESGASAAAAQLATAPICAIMFKTVPLVGVIANMAAVWLLQPIMVLGILSLIVGILSDVLAAPFVFICRALITLLLSTAKLFASLPFTTLHFIERWQTVWLIAAVILSITIICRMNSQKAALTAAVGLSAVYASMTIFGAIAALPLADIITFENSACVAVVKGGHAVLIGSPDDSRQRSDIENAFSTLGIECIDAIIVADSKQLSYDTFCLSENFGCDAICAPNDRTSAAFCHSSGVNLFALPDRSMLFGGISVAADENDISLLFKDGKMLKSEANCDIIGRYSLPMQLQGIARYRIKLQ